MSVLEAENICKSFGEHTVIDDVSLAVEKGEVFSIIGPSGAGKSTFLRCINFLEIPDSGRVKLEGEVVCGDRSRHGAPRRKDLMALRREVGMVFQSFNLFPHMSILRNLTLPQRDVLGRSKEEAEGRARELLAMVGLEDKVDEFPRRCSGGQQQRAAIARALALEPSVLLFDEPTSSLDPELGIEVLRVMRNLANSGATMLVVTHELKFAREVSDKVVVMADGRVIESGEPSQIFESSEVERTRRFVNAVEGEIDWDGAREAYTS
jgi:polar amino acid transport system ATP-binding protein